jgi:transposase
LADAGLAVGAARAVAAAAAVAPVGLSSSARDRGAMDAILLVLRTGMQWNALNATGVCSSSSAHRRFQEWEQAEVFHEIWWQGLVEYDKVVGIDWAWLAADGAMTKAEGLRLSVCQGSRSPKWILNESSAELQW